MALTDLMGDIQKAEIKYIDYEKIIPNPLNDAPIIQIEELASSILEIGLKEPLNVYKVGNQYVLDGGQRRYTAIKDYIFAKGLTFTYAGKECDEVIPAIILPRPVDELSEYESIAADNARREFDDDEDFLRYVSAVMDRYEYFVSKGIKPKGEKREWIGRMIGKKGRTATNWMNKVEEVRKLTDEVIPSGDEKGTKEESKPKKEPSLEKTVLKLNKQCVKALELADEQDEHEIAAGLQRVKNMLNMVLQEMNLDEDEK